MEDALKQKAELAIGASVANAFAALKRLVAVRKAETICAALLLAMAANLFAVISRKSITNDELVHIPAGYYHLVAGKFQLNNEHPPLVKMWATLPLLFIQPNEAQSTPGEVTGNFAEETWKYLDQFWPNNKEHFAAIFFWTRAMMIPITLGLGILIFVYARDLFGARAAALAVALYTLEPTVLAHGRIVHTDLPAAFAFLLFFFVLRYYLKARTPRRALVLGLASGLALVVKFSLIVVWPVLATLAIAGFIFAARWQESRKRIALHLAIVICVMIFVVNVAYYFRSPPIEAADVKWVQTMSAPSFNNWMTFFKVGSKVVPTYWLFGQYNVMLHNRDGHPTSLLGQYNQNGWWYYFPVAFALKTSLPFLILSVLAIGWTLWSLRRREWRSLWLIIPFAIYAAMSMSSNINIGIRHFLPAYSFLFIAAGALLDRLLRVQSARHLTIAIVASFLNGSTIAIPADEQGNLVSEAERINYLAPYRARIPEATFGNSIYLYRMKD